MISRSAEAQALARQVVKDGIVAKAAERLVYQIVETCAEHEREAIGTKDAAIAHLVAALKAHDAYMLDAGYSGPESNSLHPKAAENWRIGRAAIAKAEGRS